MHLNLHYLIAVHNFQNLFSSCRTSFSPCMQGSAGHCKSDWNFTAAEGGGLAMEADCNIPFLVVVVVSGKARGLYFEGA